MIVRPHQMNDLPEEERWFSARRLMAMSVPGISQSRENLSRFISRVATHSPHLVRKNAGRGGGLEVHLDALPDEVRAAITRRQTAAIVSLQVEAEDLADAIETDKRQINRIAYDGLTGRQRRIMEARSAVLLAIETMSMLRLCSRDKAIRGFLDDLDQGKAEAEIIAMVKVANDRTDGAQLSARTVYRWFSARSEYGVAALAPKATREKQDMPEWFPAFFEHYKKPSKPGVEDALRDYARTLPPGAYVPTQQAVRRALKKLPLLQRLKGRSGQLALRARKAYTVRDFSDLLPTSVYVADGKTFDAEIAHPLHGQPFRPELTTIIDVATRRAVGWSAALDENSSAVADALRRACQTSGVPAIFYTDRGPGYRNKAMDAPTTGLLGRAGITAMRALPYNSQAKGVVERLNQVYTAAAKALPTYMGRDMDKEAKLLAFKTTRRDLAQTGTSRLLTGWDDFIGHINQTLSAYNDRPHSSLPKIRDVQTGQLRHQTPNECWADKTNGFDLIMPSEDEARAMFRPHVVRRTRRALVDWLGNSYFDIALEPFDGQDVIVGYDIHDASTVHVHRIEEDEDGDRVPGALIAIARFDGHKTRYVPLSYERAAMERRAKGRLNRLQRKIDVVGQELHPGTLLELSASPAAALPPEPVSPPTAVASPSSASVSPDGRPVFRDDVSFASWLAANPDLATASDIALLRDLLTTHSSNELLRMSGLDLDALRKLARSTPASGAEKE